MQCKISSSKMEEFELVVQDINLEITEHQESAHQEKKWTGNHKWTVGIGKYKQFREA